MSNSNTSGNPTPTTPAKQRESRNNHAAATANPITNAQTAQAYCDAVRSATASDKPSSMFNGSGFVTPTSLDNQDTDNLVRMGASINDALARRVAQDGSEGQAAQTGLNILSDHAHNASEIQRQIRNQRIKAKYETILAAEKDGSQKARR